MKKLGHARSGASGRPVWLCPRGLWTHRKTTSITVCNSSLYEVQSYFMQTDYIRDVGAIFISENVWQQMTPEQQSAVKAAAEEAVEYEAGLVEQQMQETMDFLNENMTYGG